MVVMVHPALEALKALKALPDLDTIQKSMPFMTTQTCQIQAEDMPMRIVTTLVSTGTSWRAIAIVNSHGPMFVKNRKMKIVATQMPEDKLTFLTAMSRRMQFVSADGILVTEKGEVWGRG